MRDFRACALWRVRGGGFVFIRFARQSTENMKGKCHETWNGTQKI